MKFDTRPGPQAKYSKHIANPANDAETAERNHEALSGKYRDGRVVVAAMRLYRTDQLCVAEVGSDGYNKALAYREKALRNLLIACAMKAKK